MERFEWNIDKKQNLIFLGTKGYCSRKNIWKQVIVDKIIPSASGVYGETVTHCIGLEIVTMSDLFRTKCQLVTFCIE